MPPAAARREPPRWIAPASLCLIVLLAYSNSFQSGFVFDNKALILEDSRLHEATASNVNLILTRSYWWPLIETGLYRPVTTLSYWFNYSVLGNADRPFGYHAANVAIHAVNVLLLYALALRLGRRFWPAICAAALWAVHPLGTEAVTNIIGRADLLAGTSVLASLLAHVRARESQGSTRLAWQALVMATLTVGVFSKESAVAGLGVVVLYDLVWRNERVHWTALVRGWTPLVFPVLLLVYQRLMVLQSTAASFPFVDNPIIGAPFWIGRLTALAVVGRYLGLFFWPSRLSADYSYAQIPLSSGTTSDWAAWIAVAVAAAVAVALWRGNRLGFFCLAAGFVTLLPASNLLFASGTIMAERLMYLPSAFLIPVVVMGAFALERRVALPVAVPLLMVVACALAVRTYARNPVWHDELSLWTATVETAPHSFKSHGAFAEALYNADPTHANLPRVIDEKEKSLALIQDVPDPSAVSRPYREAATYYLERAEWLEQNRGNSNDITAAGQRAAALAERYVTLVEARPESAQDRAEARLLLSTAYERLAQGDKAVEAAREATRLRPFDPMAYRTSAAALLTARHVDGAAAELATGFMLTGNTELRAALIDLYRAGLDAKQCAVTQTSSGIVLNPDCEIVRHHLCAAGARSSQVHREGGQAALAAQAEASIAGLRCADLPRER